MKQLIRHLPEIIVDEANPFLHCKLGRESIAPILTDVVSTYGQTGTVIALDGAWGSGKTTFVRMWTQYLKNNGFALHGADGNIGISDIHRKDHVSSSKSAPVRIRQSLITPFSSSSHPAVPP